MINIAIFASGSGTNAQQIMMHFKDHPSIRVALVVSNKQDAFVLERAKKEGVPFTVINRKDFYETDETLRQLKKFEISFIVLAGFLWLVPQSLIAAYPGKIINIHPALLPKYGGKGLYGMNVHKAIIEAKEKVSGISIHLVNEQYDKGEILFQAKCNIEETDTPESLAQKIHELEHIHFPAVIEKTINR